MKNGEDTVSLLLCVNSALGDIRMTLTEKDTLCAREIGELREMLAREQERIVDAIVCFSRSK